MRTVNRPKVLSDSVLEPGVWNPWPLHPVVFIGRLPLRPLLHLLQLVGWLRHQPFKVGEHVRTPLSVCRMFANPWPLEKAKFHTQGVEAMIWIVVRHIAFVDVNEEGKKKTRTG